MRIIAAFLLLLAFLTPTTSAQAQTISGSTLPAAPPPRPMIAMPQPEAMIVLIRSSLVAFQQAAATGQYGVLHALGTAQFQRQNSVGALSSGFAPFRSVSGEMLPVLYITPQLTAEPVIIDGQLRLQGLVPGQPRAVRFDLRFEPDAGTWKMAGLAIDLIAPPAPAPLPYAPPVAGEGR